MSCCRPESIGPGPPGNRIQNNDLPYGREIYSDCVLPPCFVLRRLLPSLSRLLHVYIFSLCVSSLFICLASVLYSYTCRSSFRAIPSTLFFFTLKGCFGWWVRREAGHHLAGRRRVEISEYNLEDEFWTLVTDISCWGNCIVLKQYETIIQQGGRESEGGNTNTMLRNTFITVLTFVKSVRDKLHLQRLIVSFLVTVMIIKVFLTEHKNI